MNRTTIVLCCAAVTLSAVASARADVVAWSQDFQNPLFFTQANTTYSFADRMKAPADANRWFWGLSPHGINGSGTNPATITITNLPVHTKLTLEFDMYVIRTWDGPTNNLPLGVGPSESFVVQADSATLLNTTFSHYGVQNYPDSTGGATHPFGTGAVEHNTLGFTHPITGQPLDWVYHIVINSFSHTASSITLSFAGLDLELPSNESFGLDNMVLVVPSPGAALFTGAGLLGLARRKR